MLLKVIIHIKPHPLTIRGGVQLMKIGRDHKNNTSIIPNAICLPDAFLIYTYENQFFYARPLLFDF